MPRFNSEAIVLTEHEQRVLARDDLARLYGKAPYNTPSNPCYADGHFANALLEKYAFESISDLERWAKGGPRKQVAISSVHPIKNAPRDGTRILAWWPAFGEENNSGWVTTWFGRSRDGITGGWENPWEWERPESEYAPTHWMPHPEEPKG